MNPIRIRVLVSAITILTLGVMSSAQTVVPGSALLAHIEGKVYLNELSVEPSSTPLLHPESQFCRAHRSWPC